MADKVEKRPNIFVRTGRKFKEVFSELKKVTWPTFAKVVKSTCVVLVIVVVFLVIITAANAGLQELFRLLTLVNNNTGV
jgi:preprotein translocase subunit SecE